MLRVEYYPLGLLTRHIPPRSLGDAFRERLTIDAQANVTHSTSTPIAVGENVYLTFGQRTLLEPQTVDIIAPDPPRVGGMRETRKIADLADMYYIPVGTMASAQVRTAIPNSVAVEYHSSQLDWWEALVEEENSSRRAAWRSPNSPVSA